MFPATLQLPYSFPDRRLRHYKYLVRLVSLIYQSDHKQKPIEIIKVVKTVCLIMEMLSRECYHFHFINFSKRSSACHTYRTRISSYCDKGNSRNICCHSEAREQHF